MTYEKIRYADTDRQGYVNIATRVEKIGCS